MILAICLSATLQNLRTGALQPGQTISHSTKLVRKTYKISTSHPIRVSGKNIVVDFNGATLQGTNPTTEPDQRIGVGIEVTGSHITIKNLRVRGFKEGLIARNVTGLKLLNCDFSYNYKQKLKSTPKREDESDWMSYHDNEHDEWLRYGAGAYLVGCRDFLVSRCRATGGQCGLMLVRSNHGKVLGCNFSYLSGLGLGMYRSSDNLIQQNNIDYCVRGYSYGVYYRGQDSAGILVYEQSCRNVFAYNSVTHGGDGFFLWAGQSTMDTGKGGCNDNLVYGNDFSHAVTNAIEATFSRNTFRNNLVAQSWHGVWGGYSYDSKFEGNTFIGDLDGITIEHGQNNTISGNLFEHDRKDIELYADPITDTSWGYPKSRDTASHGLWVQNNLFQPSPETQSIDIRNTTSVTMEGNKGLAPGSGVKPDSKIAGNLPKAKWGPGSEFATPLRLYAAFTHWSPFRSATGSRRDTNAIPFLKGYPMPFLNHGERRGRDTILVDEWGPYDYRFPKLVKEASNGNLFDFTLLGPGGTFTLSSLGTKPHRVPDNFFISTKGAKTTNLDVVVQYKGPRTVDYRGIAFPAGKVIQVDYQEFIANLDWKVDFFKWDADSDPRTHLDVFENVLSGTPIATLKVRDLAFGGSRTWATDVPPNYFALVASTTIDVPSRPGGYDLEITADDGARVFLDGKLLQLYAVDGKPADSFKYQVPTIYHANLDLDGQPHALRIEFFQIDGGKTLNFSIEPHVKT